MAKIRNILPEEIADQFTVDPKAPVRFVHRIYGEYDLSKISSKAAEFLASRNIYLKKKKPKENPS